MSSLAVTGTAGCLLGALIVGNLLFGWLFFAPLTWLGIEFLLIMLFRLYALFSMKKLQRDVKHRRNRDVIDVEGRVVDDKGQ